ncbi:HAD-IIB family hydrolase [Geitlerinema sp. PCC 9228]|uniref:HAD-IIB family hydrolase n=1 Tax=Geitlerinema sp. PCC 9228 TaxID=111611 RepID=UPI0008F9B242|nr:HAD-IIB family hydrolase [Geitlerinema sp. PCC 9228]
MKRRPLRLSTNNATKLAATCLLATDMDGTLTISGKLTTQVLQAFQNLQKKPIPALIVTGRSAGWVSGLTTYLPVYGAIAENGGLFYPANSHPPRFLTPIADISSHRQKLADAFAKLQARFPYLQASTDNGFRISDWTFDVQNIPPREIPNIQQFCQELGWGFTYSAVQCHIKPPQQDKATGLQCLLAVDFPDCSRDRVLTVGDSPNDESLFDPKKFPLSVGVANLLPYRDRMNHLPTYITAAAEGEGFCELVRYLLSFPSTGV